MMETGSQSCCFINCMHPGEPTDLRIAIWPPSDLPVVQTVAHSTCFYSIRESSVEPDPVEDAGRIPASARCVFCGGKLPIVGRHPYALEIQDRNGSRRFWVHADCFESTI